MTMWADQALSKLPQGKICHRNELFQIFQSEKPDLTDSTFRWALYNLQQDQKLFRAGYNAYTVAEQTTLPVWQPLYSMQADSVMQFLDARFSALSFVMFESVLLNEFLNHQIAQNTIYVQVEKDISSFAFDVLQDAYDGRVLYRPGKKELEHYWAEGCLIVLDLISQAPLSTENPHEISAEKLLVDIIAEKSIAGLFSQSELPSIFESMTDSYQIDSRKMFRYAGRRGKTQLIRQYVGEEK